MIASYAPLVFEAYRAQDWAAKEILQSNMRAVARLIQGAASRLPHLREIPVVLCGGLTCQGELLLPLLQEALPSDGRCYSIRLCERSMARGALILAGMNDKDKKGENEYVEDRNEK